MRRFATFVLVPLAIASGTALSAQRQSTPIGSQRAHVDERLRDVVARGHKWLASQQHPSGYWSQEVGFKLNSDYRITSDGPVPHVGVTALALMSFLAGGHLPDRGEYGQVLSRGLDYILNCIGENGYISDNGTRMYSHAFATLLLAEVYGMTKRADVRQRLQDSVNLIVDSQNAEGGWRYKPFARESDMSITVCQVLALRSSRNVGVMVPASTIRLAELYVERSAVTDGGGPYRGLHRYGGMLEEGGAFRYQIQPHSRATFPLTAAGVTTLFAAGSYDHRMVVPALEYLEKNMDHFNRSFGPEGHYFFYYGHYYAVQAFYIAGGDKWNLYFSTMKRDLYAMQRASGEWPCETGPGPAFGTAIATLVLQIPFQYLPIFQR
jgi:hypothetical protein